MSREVDQRLCFRYKDSTRIVQSHFFLNPNLQLLFYSPVSVEPGRKLRRFVDAAQIASVIPPHNDV